MEAQEIEKIVAALRCTGLSEKCDSCDYGYHLCQDSDCNDACDNEKLDKDAADAIERLIAERDEAKTDLAAVGRAFIREIEQHEPKRGKWVGVSPMVDTVQCSACGGQLFSAELETPYCPYFGAKM